MSTQKKKKKGEKAQQNWPTVSVVIAARNEAANLKRCLESLDALSYPKDRMEVIVVDDGSIDETPDLLREQACHTLRTNGVGPSCARNLGILMAKGDLIAFTDADCVVHPDWLTELVTVCLEYNAASVGGSQGPYPSESAFGREVQAFLKAMGFIGGYTKDARGICKVQHNPTCNVIYWRDVLLEAGGFDESLWPGEDLDLDLRLGRMGYSSMYNPRAVVAHKRPGTIASFARMMYRYGKFSGGILSRRYGLFRLLSAEPLMLCVAGGAALALLVWGPFGMLLLLCGVLLLSIVLLARFLRVGSKRPWISFFLFLLTLGAWNWGYLAGFRSPGKWATKRSLPFPGFSYAEDPCEDALTAEECAE